MATDAASDAPISHRDDRIRDQRGMQRKLDYTQEEVRVLKDILVALTGSQRISFTADQRRRLAVAGKALSPGRAKEVLPDCEARDDPRVVPAAGEAKVRQLEKQGRSTAEED